MDYQAEIEAIAKSINDHPCTAEQGLKESEVKQMQLHYLKGNDEHPEFFALVMETIGSKCKVVPGTLDAYSAGTNDVILPRSAMGGYVALSLDMEQELPVEALGIGFARLDKPTFVRVQESLARFHGSGLKIEKPLRSAFPYVSDHDSRIIARCQLKEAVTGAVGFEARREKGKGTVWQPFYGREDYALAAGGKLPPPEVFIVRETELSVVYSPEDQMTTFTFYNRDDEPDSTYDGYGLVGAGVFLGTFRNGSLRVPSASVKDWYQIVDREGREVVLSRK